MMHYKEIGDDDIRYPISAGAIGLTVMADWVLWIHTYLCFFIDWSLRVHIACSRLKILQVVELSPIKTPKKGHTTSQ